MAELVGESSVGIYLLRDPHAATYLVDHTGTRRVEVHHTDVALEWAA
jgi:hypothetical protein